MSRVPSHTAFLSFLCRTSENAQAPLFPHFLNRAQPPAEPAGQRGALWGGVCVHVLFCMRVFPVACVWWVWGWGGELVHLGGGMEIYRFHTGFTAS